MRLPGISVPGVDSDDWYTPPYIFETLGMEFDLDPAAPPGGVPWIPAKRHYSEADDGLSQPWFGYVWLNPPYSSPGPWVARLAEHGSGLALIPADTASKWWHDHVVSAWSVCFLRHRVTFIREGNDNVTSARFPSAIAAWGYSDEWLRNSSDLGWVVFQR